ncbi:hypothetical protein [Tardiphaga sp.]|uniref:hypothetical protein n=1 Tax=Tardiphaga sp. TaxID=1926292 RepID=UPI002612C762|nr:hypothetical protein [Tardiphaga sp.]MDB5620305.1 hypothetical protein [Tardiphaga sp.]
MAIKDILLPLIGEATPAAIEKCVAMAVDIEARISAVAIETEVDGGGGRRAPLGTGFQGRTDRPAANEAFLRAHRVN